MLLNLLNMGPDAGLDTAKIKVGLSGYFADKDTFSPTQVTTH